MPTVTICRLCGAVRTTSGGRCYVCGGTADAVLPRARPTGAELRRWVTLAVYAVVLAIECDVALFGGSHLRALGMRAQGWAAVRDNQRRRSPELPATVVTALHDEARAIIREAAE
jgi:hypothetical protein